MFLETEHMTQYDLDVIESWRQGFSRKRDTFGVQPDIWERIAYLKARGARRFPHIQYIGGRRGSKGFNGGILGAEQVAYFRSLDNWQTHFGVDEGKDGYMQIGATSQTQAKAQLFADVRSMVTRCRYLRPDAHGVGVVETKDYMLAVRTPSDVRMIAEMKAARVPIDHLVASLKVQALSASAAAFRGATAFGIMLDEFAFMVETGSAKSGDAIYEDAHPSLDQFDLDALTYIPSSPYQKSGKCYSLFQEGSVLLSSYTDREGLGEEAKAELQALAAQRGEDTAEIDANPTMLVVQLPSWGLYEDFDRSEELIGVYIKRPIQPGPEHESQRRRKLRNPEKFAVERCLDPNTRVLCADYTWRRIDDLRVGDELVGFDEYAHTAGAQRKMQTSVVRAKFDSLQAAYRIMFDDGTSVTCSADHRWLSTKENRPGRPMSSRWRKIAPGDTGPRTVLGVGDSIRFVAEPWGKDESYEAGYLAGFMDGEGTLQRGGGRGGWQLSWAQLPGEVSDEVLHLLKKKGFEPVLRRDSDPLAGEWHEGNQRTRSAAQGWAINGFAECARFLGSIGGVKLRRQAGRMWEGKAIPRPREYGRNWKQIVAIEELPPQRLVDIETSTATFIAEGFATHNCAQWAEVMGAYFDSDKIDRMFTPIPWRPNQLEAQSRGYLKHKYRIHCDPGRTGANFAVCVGHIEEFCATCGWYQDEPTHQHPVSDACAKLDMQAHVIIDLLHVWRPQDFPPDVETGKPTIDYSVVQDHLRQLLNSFPSTSKISFDQWNSALGIAQLRKEFSPGIRVTEVTFTEKENQSRFEKVKSALNMEMVHSYRDRWYEDNGSLLEMELKFLSVRGGRVVKQEVGPVTTKDLCDAFCVVVSDLLHDALERYGAKDDLARGAYGSTDVFGLRSGRELARMGITTGAMSSARQAMAELYGQRSFNPGRAGNIHARRDQRRGGGR
jgi:hypothetical protein